MPERLITLTELKQYFDEGKTLSQVISIIESTHGVVKIFDHAPKLMAGQRFRYFVMPLTADGQPIVEFAKGANIQ